MNLMIVIPARPPAEGKTRLALHLPQAQRERLSRLLFHHVVRTACRFAGPSRCLVVSRSHEYLGLAERLGAHGLREAQEGQNAALAQAAAAAASLGADGLLALSCDLPLLEEADLSSLVEAGREVPVVLACDKWGSGTNALLVRPIGAVPFGFGPSSLEAHLTGAANAGLAATIVDRHGLSLDLDTCADLLLLGRLCAARSARSVHGARSGAAPAMRQRRLRPAAPRRPA
ncbi:2-phospho-L-lactate guanylyltransferase [Sphingosinicella terrae]|uniref:2-phospho-L-lactate guanylyltransferase n=1 Tax=Sphingosinicella terrae TaxID=2172047 RepID=UPI000E0CE720|nr:2-phospho-L-lactate guanylyltransferase [Sphingosinicella terrae]